MCFIAGFALLTGTPIAGVLVQPPNYVWHRPIIFAGVSAFYKNKHDLTRKFQVNVLFGAFLLFVSRSMQSKRKGTSRL